MLLPFCSLYRIGFVISAAFFIYAAFLYHQILLQTEIFEAILLAPLLGLLGLCHRAFRFH